MILKKEGQNKLQKCTNIKQKVLEQKEGMDMNW